MYDIKPNKPTFLMKRNHLSSQGRIDHGSSQNWTQGRHRPKLANTKYYHPFDFRCLDAIKLAKMKMQATGIHCFGSGVYLSIMIYVN
jgi:hypothetical protein